VIRKKETRGVLGMELEGRKMGEENLMSFHGLLYCGVCCGA